MRDIIRLLRATFSCGFCYFGGDSESATTNNTTQIDARVVGGAGGANISGSGNSVIVSTSDYGAITSGKEVATSAMATVNNVATNAFGVANNAITASTNTTRESLDFADGVTANALGANTSLASSAISAGTSLANRTIDASRGFLSDSLDANAYTFNKATGLVDDAFTDALSATKSTFAQSLDGLGKAYETAKAGDQRIVSMVALAVVGLAAIFVIPSMVKKG